MERRALRWEPWERDGALEYEVLDVLDSRGSGRNKEYLIHWKGQTREQATWEPVENLANCRSRIRAFNLSRHRQQQNLPALDSQLQQDGGEATATPRPEGGEAAAPQLMYLQSPEDEASNSTSKIYELPN